MRFVRLLLFSYIFHQEIVAIRLEKSLTVNYFDGLVNYLQSKSKLYQVVFILDDQFDNADPMMNSLMKAVDEHFPSLSLSYDQISVWFGRFSNKNFKTHMHYRRTTLFVFQANNKNTIGKIYEDVDVINSMTDLALPRCLIMMSFNTTNEYLNTTLHSFWKKSYLDITIMTYDQRHQVKPFLHQINPFTNTYITQELSPDIQWFPNKIQDLKGYKMSLNFISVLNTAKRRIEIKEKITQIFEKGMNFTQKAEIPHGCKKHFLRFLVQKYIKNNDYSSYDTKSLRILKIDSIKAIIPKRNSKKVLAFSPELLYMIVGTVSMIVIIRFLVLLLRFERTTWQTLNISQIIIGMPANPEPNNWLQRIVFGSLLIACTVYTGYFYSVILDISLQSEPEISTLEELADSTLIPFINLKLCLRLKNSSFPFLKILGDKCKTLTLLEKWNKFHCLEYMVKYKNVSCMYEDAEYHVNTYSSVKRQELNVIILPETIEYYTYHWESRNNSPFTDRYNELILKASEFGFFNEFYASNAINHKTSLPEEIGEQKILFITSYVLGMGYSLSVIVFLFELFFAMLDKSLFAFYSRFRLDY